MDTYDFDPRFGPIGYQPVEFLDDTSGERIRPSDLDRPERRLLDPRASDER
jgi:hypothetical protein